jgi:uncharacterized protein (DUF433 family)
MAIAVDRTLVRHIKPLPPELIDGDLIQPGNQLFGVIWINPQRLSGALCFYGTRVPIQNFFDYLEGGKSLADFLAGFPGVTREQAVAVLEMARLGLLAELPDVPSLHGQCTVQCGTGGPRGAPI